MFKNFHDNLSTNRLPVLPVRRQTGEALPLRDGFRAGAVLADRSLPPRVTLQAQPVYPIAGADHMVELQVLKGNAVYRPGECFRLSPARARAAYGVVL